MAVKVLKLPVLANRMSKKMEESVSRLRTTFVQEHGFGDKDDCTIALVVQLV